MQEEEGGWWRVEAAIARRWLPVLDRRPGSLAGSALALAAGRRAWCLACDRGRGAGAAPGPRVQSKADVPGHHLRTARRNIYAGGHLCRRGGAAPLLGGVGCDSCRADAARHVSGPARLGLRRRGSVRPLAGVRHSRGPDPVRRGMPRARIGRAARCGLQPSGSRWQLPRQLRTVLHRPREDAVGRGRQLRRRRERRGAPVRHRQRTHVAAGLWVRRLAARRGACDLQFRGDAHPGRAGGRGAAAGGGAASKPGADRRERSERSAAGASRLARRLRSRRALER